MIYQDIFRRFIFPAAELFSGTSIQKNLRFLEESQFWPRHKMERYQEERLKKVISHAYENVPYYRKVFDSLKLKPGDIKSRKDLKKLPFLTKRIVNENLEDLRAKNYRTKSFTKLTSGSTGTPSKFYRANDDYSWEWAAFYRAWEWAGGNIGDKYVKFSLNDDRYRLNKRIQDWLIRCLYIYIYKVSDEDLHTYYKKIVRFKPKFIYGYTSSINVMAEFMEKNNIRYDAKAVITMGSKLLPSFRRRIEDRFRCKVYDGYGCGGEGLNIAAQCELGSYHINEELMIVETDNKEVAVTSLDKYAMPLIRYKPDDFVNLGKPCKCGRTLATFRNIEGRSHEIVKNKRGETFVIEFFISAFEHIEGIIQYKVIQDRIDRVKIQLIVDERFNKSADEKKIKEFIQNSTGKDLKVEYEYPNKINSTNSGKTMIIESKI